MQMHDGIKYYTYADYAIFYSRFLSNTDCEEEGRAVIEEAYEYCSQHNFPKKAAILMAELENRRVYTDMLSDRQLPEKEIVDVCEVVMHTMNLIRNSFSFDRLLFLEKDVTQNIITHASENVFLKNTDEVALVDFFAEYKVEFVVVIPEQSEEFAREVAADIQRQLKKDSDIRNVIDGEKITSSVGISSYENSDRKGLEDALKWADKALYYVKEREKGNVATWSQLDE